METILQSIMDVESEIFMKYTDEVRRVDPYFKRMLDLDLFDINRWLKREYSNLRNVLARAWEGEPPPIEDQGNAILNTIQDVCAASYQFYRGVLVTGMEDYQEAVQALFDGPPNMLEARRPIIDARDRYFIAMRDAVIDNGKSVEPIEFLGLVLNQEYETYLARSLFDAHKTY
jgi:hypothetical protein